MVNLTSFPSRMEITENQYKLAMIGEMIHVAGLVHDDVVDEADSRRGKRSLNALWGNKAVLLTTYRGHFSF